MGLEGGTVIAALPRDLARKVLEQARRKIEDSIDRMKTESGDLPLVAVGGGRLSRARSGRRNLAGDPRAARRLRQCGGSAIAQISGEDRPGLSRPRPRQGNRVRQSANAGAPGRRRPSRCSTSFRDLRSNGPSTQSEFGSEEEVVPKAPSQGGTESSNLLSSSGESPTNLTFRKPKSPGIGALAQGRDRQF
jgi:hypothetical protein